MEKKTTTAIFYGLTRHFWIKLFENVSLERSFGYAGEEF